MIGHRITLLGSHDDKLRTWLEGHPEGHERGAIVLFRRIARVVKHQVNSDRFTAVDIIPMDGDWVISDSPIEMTFNMRNLPELYLRCELENLELGFVHNHPGGYLDFSDKDDINEKNILHGLSGCNGKKSYLVSLVLSQGKWIGRIRQGEEPNTVISVRHVSIISNRLDVYCSQESLASLSDDNYTLARQEAAFGKPFNVIMQSLRVVIVGAGGTGSPTATLLARCGVGEIIIIDGDDLEGSNMNRVRGFRMADVGRNKAIVMAEFINSLEMNTTVSAIDSYLNESAEALDALASADVIVGCTDDHMGRNLMNHALYYHAQAYIDMGLAGMVDDDEEGHPYLRDQRGRVSCILPESGACLRCQRVISEASIEYEEKTKANPELLKLDAETLMREHYIEGGGEESPGVGPFTSMTADNAVATLMNLVRNYRDISEEIIPDNIWIDFIHMNIHSNESNDDPDCIFCRRHLLLNRAEGKYHLEMPGLGIGEICERE